MLTKIEVEDLQGNTLSLPLQDNSAGYTVTNVDGLDPVKATIVSSPFAQLDGSQFQASRRENRNVVMTIGIEPYFGGSTVRSLRAALYAYFMPKTNVNLKFYDDGVLIATIGGQVESCEAPLFSKDPSVAVSIICFDPSFLAPAYTTVNGNTVSTTTEQTIAYPGTTEAGYLLTLNVNRSLSAFSIYNRRPDGTVGLIDVTYAFLAGDVVKINTVSKNKYITVTRAGIVTSILYAVSSTSKWNPLYPGNNYYRVLATGAAIPFTIGYTAKYGGL